MVYLFIDVCEKQENLLLVGTVPSTKKFMVGTVLSSKKLVDGIVPTVQCTVQQEINGRNCLQDAATQFLAPQFLSDPVPRRPGDQATQCLATQYLVVTSSQPRSCGA